MAKAKEVVNNAKQLAVNNLDLFTEALIGFVLIRSRNIDFYFDSKSSILQIVPDHYLADRDYSFFL